ncbi:MAG: UDP-glucuronate 4-epimerase [Thermodesulfobacteriota bacterium]|nr:UDP-glucuronate 4-epimerase [Thermodesulfobacteriota bacterium]
MSRVLVTGSAGFIGFHIARRLLSNKHNVIGIDNFNSYYAPILKRTRTDILHTFRDFISVELDLSDQDSVEKCFRDYQPEIVCHLAAQAGVRYSLRNPYAYEKSNVAGFLNIIEQARQLEGTRFVYASSSSVYGGNTKMPYSESDPVNTPISLYAATKRANEMIAYTYHHLYGLQTVGLRFFTVYGEWGRPDMAYWSFVENMLHGETIRVFNHGRNSRDFTFVDDIVSGMEKALFSPSLDGYEIINLGNNQPVQLMEFIAVLEDLTGVLARKEMIPAQPGDVVSTYADISRAQEKLGFHPRIGIHEGLARFVRWFEKEESLTRAVRAFRKRAES